MKLRDLNRDQIKLTSRMPSATRLSQADLRRITAGRDVDPEICAIHDYYLHDALA